jgi:triosephosphate isomerase
VWLTPVSEVLFESGVKLGAQDCFWEQSGAYTGEISPAMVKALCQWVIVGHSERRLYLGETDEMVAKKTAAALTTELGVIMCVGELADHYDAGLSDDIVSGQVRAGLANCSADDSARLVLAYEPVWAIGSGKNADPEHAYKTMRLIRKIVGEMIGAGAARKVRILYGGSVKANNVQSYVELPLCDGVLVGGASLDAEEFAHIVKTTAEVYGHR